MNRRTFTASVLGLGMVGALPPLAKLASSRNRPLLWRNRVLTGFGTVLTMQAAHQDENILDAALDKAVAAVRRVERLMSLFNPNSALNRLNSQGILERPPAELLDVLRIAQRVSAFSDGAFDVTIQPLWRAFENARREGRLPTEKEVEKARSKVGWSGLRVAAGSLSFQKPGMAATLNGIAQGYATDLVRGELAAQGIRHALINAGEWTALGRRRDDAAWSLGVQDPSDRTRIFGRMGLSGKSIAVSSDRETTFSQDQTHHHIFNPHTGYSPTEISCVVVAADRCVVADALTKVFFNAGMEKSLMLADYWKTDVLVIDKQGQWRKTKGFDITPLTS